MYIDTKYKFFYNEITIRNIKEATMDRLRGFEIAKGWEDKGINLPKRSTKNSAGYDEFKKALYKVNEELAKLIAKDGEGATKLIQVTTNGAKTLKDAKKVSKSVITSSLFKAAVFGGDPNWGRILCAVGYSEADLMIDKVNIFLKAGNDMVQVAKNGMAQDFDIPKAEKILKAETVEIIIELNDGEFEATAWGCDLSYDYVKINAEYHT